MKKLSKLEVKKRVFRKFLYDNDALEAWYENRRKDNESWKRFWKKRSYQWINGAFLYANTKEGSDYWIDISRKWHEINE